MFSSGSKKHTDLSLFFYILDKYMILLSKKSTKLFPCVTVGLRTASCIVRRQQGWWPPWPRPSRRLRSPPRPGRSPPCRANWRWKCTFTAKTRPHRGWNHAGEDGHLNWGPLRSTLRPSTCFPVDFTISVSTAIFSSSRPRPSRADTSSALGSVNW